MGLLSFQKVAVTSDNQTKQFKKLENWMPPSQP
jgi:hypothetical protein